MEFGLQTILPLPEIALRLAVATGLGAVVGFDREIRAKPAGLRTHSLVALAAATLTIATLEIFYSVEAREPSGAADPLRVIQAVFAGLGLLAAGTVIQGRGEVHGLTTGASVFNVGGIGIAAGAGFFWVAVVATVLGLAVLIFFKHVEDRLLGRDRRPDSAEEEK